MNKESKRHQLWIGSALVLIAIILIAIAVVNAMRGETTGDTKIISGERMSGLTCKDETLMHPALIDKPADSYENTITAVFRDDELSSISLMVEGNYKNESMTREGMYFAQANYNLTLVNKYNEEDDIFSIGFSVNGTMLQMVQTTRDIDKVNADTVTYFLLDRGMNIAKTPEGLKKQYEAKGFSCEITN